MTLQERMKKYAELDPFCTEYQEMLTDLQAAMRALEVARDALSATRKLAHVGYLGIVKEATDNGATNKTEDEKAAGLILDNADKTLQHINQTLGKD